MQADGLADRIRLAVNVGEVDIEVADLPEAVTAEPQRVGGYPDPVLADVEGVAPALERPRIGVRDKQLGHRGTPDDRPYRALILVSHGVHDKALAGVEAQPQAPALPANLPAPDLEPRALGLDDLERPQIVAQRSDAIGGIGTRTGGQRHRPE